MNAIVLITGASSGIGLALSKEFHRRGHSVIATARTIDPLIAFTDPTFTSEKLDVTDEPAVAALARRLHALNAVPDILVNNAGYGLIGPAMEFTDNELKHQYETNLFGLMNMVRAFGPLMCVRKSGLIVNIGSISGLAPLPFSGAYASTKAAVHALSESLRMELSPFRVNVMVVQPGGIISNFAKVSDAKVTETLKRNSRYSALESRIRERARISQIGATPAEVFARAVVTASLRPHPPRMLRTGKRSFFLPLLKHVLPGGFFDAIMERKFGLSELR